MDLATGRTANSLQGSTLKTAVPKETAAVALTLMVKLELSRALQVSTSSNLDVARMELALTTAAVTRCCLQLHTTRMQEQAIMLAISLA